MLDLLWSIQMQQSSQRTQMKPRPTGFTLEKCNTYGNMDHRSHDSHTVNDAGTLSSEYRKRRNAHFF